MYLVACYSSPLYPVDQLMNNSVWIRKEIEIYLIRDFGTENLQKKKQHYICQEIHKQMSREKERSRWKMGAKIKRQIHFIYIERVSLINSCIIKRSIW